MTQNLLKLNDNKTNILYLASPHCVKSLKTPAIQIGAFSITPNGSVKNLCFFNQCINMYEHVTSVCWAAYYHLKNIHCLKTFLTQEALVTVVHAFVTSRIDYCNSLLYGISDYNINQRIQNSAARIVTDTGKYDNITPILQKLHWLPVRHPFEDFINDLYIYQWYGTRIPVWTGVHKKVIPKSQVRDCI